MKMIGSVKALLPLIKVQSRTQKLSTRRLDGRESCTLMSIPRRMNKTSSQPNLYALLGVSQDASKEEIRA